VGRHQLFKKKKRCSSSSSSSCVKKKCTTKVNKNRFEEEDTHTKNVFFFQNFFPNKLSQNESLGSLKISQIFFLAKEKPLRKKKKKKCRRRRRREKKEKNKGKKCPRR
jgi:hypothetical protein